MKNGREYQYPRTKRGTLTPRQARKLLDQVKDIPIYLETRGFKDSYWWESDIVDNRSTSCPIAQFFTWETGLHASVGAWDVGFRKNPEGPKDELSLSLTDKMIEAVRLYDLKYYNTPRP